MQEGVMASKGGISLRVSSGMDGAGMRWTLPQELQPPSTDRPPGQPRQQAKVEIPPTTLGTASLGHPVPQRRVPALEFEGVRPKALELKE